MTWMGRMTIATVCLSAFACGVETAPPEREYMPETGQVSEPLTVTMVNKGNGILPNVRVIQVLYGAGTYMPSLTNGQMSQFYRDVTNSSYIDWLSDYSTPSIPGQTIGRGSFDNAYTITPSAPNSGLVVNFLQIAAEISAQIAAHHLPAPTKAGSSLRTNSLYMVHVPRGVTLSVGPPGYEVQSCGPNNVGPPGAFFCGYHDQALAAVGTGYEIYQIAIFPDFGHGSGCDVQRDPDAPQSTLYPCGTNGNAQNLTAIASHELIEAVTDPAPGRSWVEVEPQGTPAPEIADICERQYDTFVGGSGATWTVQKGWSVTRNACVAHP